MDCKSNLFDIESLIFFGRVNRYILCRKNPSKDVWKQWVTWGCFWLTLQTGLTEVILMQWRLGNWAIFYKSCPESSWMMIFKEEWKLLKSNGQMKEIIPGVVGLERYSLLDIAFLSDGTISVFIFRCPKTDLSWHLITPRQSWNVIHFLLTDTLSIIHHNPGGA